MASSPKVPCAARCHQRSSLVWFGLVRFIQADIRFNDTIERERKKKGGNEFSLARPNGGLPLLSRSRRRCTEHLLAFQFQVLAFVVGYVVGREHDGRK